MYDLIILGGGPAGVAGGVYAARKHLKTALITKSFGGQSIDSFGIENWIGDIKITGLELAKKLEDHLLAYSKNFVDIKKPELVEKIIKTPSGHFEIQTNKNQYETKTILIATGASRKKLNVLGADKFEHKGLTYCASCDGPFFEDKIVAVIGGGNSAFESAMQLLAYTKKVYIIHRRDIFRADPVTVERVSNDPKIKIITDANILEVFGDDLVKGLKYKNKKTDAVHELQLDGIFVEIGHVPASHFVENLVEMEENKSIKIDPWTQRTSVSGIWAAGDVTNGKFHQNNISAGDAVKAVEDIYTFIKSS